MSIVPLPKCTLNLYISFFKVCKNLLRDLWRKGEGDGASEGGGVGDGGIPIRVARFSMGDVVFVSFCWWE